MFISIVTTDGFLGTLTEEECRACSLEILGSFLKLIFVF
jgi:hypothetical protein